MYAILEHHTPEQAAEIARFNTLAQGVSDAARAFGISSDQVAVASLLAKAQRRNLIIRKMVAF